MMLLALANPCVGAIVAPGGSAHGRTLRTPRASASMLDSVGPSFLLGKLDLSQVRVEREAMDSVLEQIDRNVATVMVPLPEMPVPPAALAHLSDHASTAALAATSSGGGGGFPLIPVVLVAIPA